jgi:hypothetical protein
VSAKRGVKQMEQFLCPLCKQEVTKIVFEKITGIWQEKEKRMLAVKNKENELMLREQKMLKKFNEDKKKLTASMDTKFKADLDAKLKAFRRSAQKERAKLEKEKTALERKYKNELVSETNRLLNQEKLKQEHIREELKEMFDKQSKLKIEKSNKALEKDKEKFEREKKVQGNRYNQLNRQFSALQNKNATEIQKREEKIRLLQEQLRKNKTPSELGFSNETDMLAIFKAKFPTDIFDHTGKGGDIVHHINSGNKEIGIIVYELKKVSNFSNSHINQTFIAKQKRNADYAILITNAKRSKTDFGFSLSKGIIIIHPAGALTIINILREHLVSISKLKLSNKQREEATRAVLEYIQSPMFKNSIESIIDNTVELYSSMKKEIKEHVNIWQDRFDRYSDINNKALIIENKVVKLITSKDDVKKRLIKDSQIVPIELPGEIK